MIINNLYETNITVNQYEASLNSTLTVTVKLVDFNGVGVSGVSATVKVDKGYFSRIVGETVADYSNTTTKTTTMNTDANGELTITYHASSGGLVTFSANNTKVHCYITSTNTTTLEMPITKNTSYISTSNSYFYLTKVSNDFVIVEYGIRTSSPLPSKPSTANSNGMFGIYDSYGYIQLGTISNTSFRPPGTKYFDSTTINTSNSNCRISIKSDGEVWLWASPGKSINVYGSGIYSFVNTFRTS